MIRKKVEGARVGLGSGFPVARIVQLASKFDSTIHVKTGNMCDANAKSLMSMMLLDINFGGDIVITAEGRDEKQAVEAIESFFLGR